MQFSALLLMTMAVAVSARHVVQLQDAQKDDGIPPPSLKHDTDVGKISRPNKVLFLVNVIRPATPTQDPVETNEVDTSDEKDQPQVVRVLVEADIVNSTEDDYKPLPVPDGSAEELSPPPLEQSGLRYDWTKEDASVVEEPSGELQPPPNKPAINLDWSIPSRLLLPPLEDREFISQEGETKDSSYLPEKLSSGQPGPDDFGASPEKDAASIYDTTDRDTYLPEAGEVRARSDGPAPDDFLAIGVPPKESEKTEYNSEKSEPAPDSYVPHEPSSSEISKSDDFIDIGTAPAEPKKETKDSYFPDTLSFSNPKYDDYVDIGVPPKGESPKAFVKDSEKSSTQVQTDPAIVIHHDHEPRHEHVHDEVHASTPSSLPVGDQDDTGSVTTSESTGSRKKRHLLKHGGFGGGFVGVGVPPISISVVKGYGGGGGGYGGGYGGGGYCDVCGRPVVQQPIVQQPIYEQPIVQPVVQPVVVKPIYKPVYQQPVYQPQPVCDVCNQPVYQPPPCNSCGGGGGGGGGSYSQSFSQSSSQSSSSSGGWGKK